MYIYSCGETASNALDASLPELTVKKHIYESIQAGIEARQGWSHRITPYSVGDGLGSRNALPYSMGEGSGNLIAVVPWT